LVYRLGNKTKENILNYIRVLRYLARAFAVFILFTAFLQIQDGYSTYGAISVGLGLIAIYLSRNRL
jgi:hypothetical protein